MNILEQIMHTKRAEVAARKAACPPSGLEAMPLFRAARQSLAEAVRAPGSTGIIAEYKRQSPSKGIINGTSSVEEVTAAYASGGASGISVLTDTRYFGGNLEDLEAAYGAGRPLLRKDFVFDEYQLLEARAYGASVVLLIAACLQPKEVKRLARSARSLELEVLLELHEERELDHVCDDVQLVGINNRNLKDFAVDLDHSVRLARRIDPKFVRVAESGIGSPDTVNRLRGEGFDAFLIGEHFMRAEDPAIAFREFVEGLNKDGHGS